MTKAHKFMRQQLLLSRSIGHRLGRRLAPPVAGNLDALAVLYGTDKALGRHGYTPYYARHLDQRRHTVRQVLEIGIGGKPYDDPYSGGSSLRMWRSFFPNATVYGLDIHKKILENEPRIVVLQGDQSDPDSLERAVASCPAFDLIVDDGSHIASHITTAFNVLFPKLRAGGIYAIEDLHTAYWRGYGGGSPGTAGTGVALAKDLLDDVNIGPRPVAAIHAYWGIVFVEKAEKPAVSFQEPDATLGPDT